MTAVFERGVGRWHVHSHPAGWCVRRHQARRARRVFGSRNEAVLAARSLAARDGERMVVHETSGMVDWIEDLRRGGLSLAVEDGGALT